MDYLGRYTHKVAISNHRLLKLEDGRVSFRWRNYRQAKEGTGKALQIMTLEADEFIRRFLLHVLPRGFVRIRRYGLLANRQRGANLARARELLDAAPPVTEEPLDWEDLYRKLTGRSIGGCRKCGQGQMSTVERIPSLWERLQELRLGVHQPLNPVSRALAALYLQRVRQLENELIRVMTKAVATVPGIDSS